MRAHKGPAAGVVEVALHEEVEQVSGVAADGAQLGVAALEGFVAQRGAHVSPAVEEGAGELGKHGREFLTSSFRPDVNERSV